MIKTTLAYREAVKENGIFHHEVRIEFLDGSTITVDDMDIFSLQISEASSNTNSFDLGAVNANQLTLKLNNIDGKFDTHDFSEALITVKIGLELPDGSIEWLNKGSFNAEPGEESGNTIAVKAFDYMVKFDQLYSVSKLAYPATLGNIVRDACSCCGVTLAPDTTSFDNDNYVVQNRPDDSSVTFRQILQWVGQIACKFFVINIDGKLSARWYNTEILESMWGYKEDGGFYNINGELIEDSSGLIIVEETEGIIKTDALLSGSVIKTDDVVITGIKVVEEDQGDTSDETTYQSGAEGYVLEISGNKLIQDGNGATIASYLGERLNGLQFRPMEVDVPTDPAREAGDLGLVTDARGRHYKTIFTNIEYAAHAAQKLTSGAEAPTRLSSVRYSQATRVYKELRANLKKQKTEWDAAFDELQSVMKTKNGLFPIRETQEDGSSILYFCDKPELSDASIVVKFSAVGWAMSTDGGKTWNSGWLVDGSMIASILNAIGINAKWINTGALTIKDPDGKIIFEVDVDKKSVYMNPDVLKIGNVALSDKIKSMDNSIAAAKNMTMILSNEYQAVAADANGKIEGTFPVIQTKVMVMHGFSDISADCSYTITKSAAVAGTWDETARAYTVTELNADDGWIDIKAVYLQNLSITKRFTVSKVRSGTNGKDGTPGRTYILEPSCNVLKRGSDKVISPNFITFKAYYRDGDSAARVPYKGRFIVEETVDGSAWKTIYISSTDEDTVTHYLYSILTNSSGQAVASSNGSTIGIPRDVTNVRCKLYASGGTTTLMDMQSVAVVIDVDNLTQSQIVEILSNDGAWKGLYYKNGQLYISFSAALGGELTLGGANNGNGKLIARDANGNQIGKWDNTGAYLTGTLKTMLSSSAQNVYIKIDAQHIEFIDAAVNNKEPIASIWGTPVAGDTTYIGTASIDIGPNCQFDISGNSWAMLQMYPDDDHTTKIMGNFQVIYGTKSRVAETKNFSDRLLYCYETPTPLFGDLGCGRTNDKGIAIIDIDQIFAETVSADAEYQVFLQKEGSGDIWVEEKEQEYFVVKGTPNLKFSWEIKCMQKGFEHLRLNEESQIPTVSKDITNYEIDSENIINTTLYDYDKEMEELINESS